MNDAIDTLKKVNLGRISLTVTMIPDYNPDLSWLGEYSNTPAEGAIETGRTGPRFCRYFNPLSEIKEYAQKDFEHMEAYGRDEWVMVGICATIELDGRIIGEDSIWGIEYEFETKDYHRETMCQMARSAIVYARTFLASIGKSKHERDLEAALTALLDVPVLPGAGHEMQLIDAITGAESLLEGKEAINERV